MSRAVYFDNNATTFQCPESRKQQAAWAKLVANPSGSSEYSVKAKALLHGAISYVQKLCNASEYTVLFTSGAAESNTTIIKSSVDAWERKTSKSATRPRPHIVVSAIEHTTILSTVKSLVDAGRLAVTYVKPNAFGQISPAAVASAIRNETCLVSVMAANNETGAINPVQLIAAECHKRGVPFHSDCVQIFGKKRLNLPELGLDAISVSFHKLYGPPGVGMLIIRNSFIKGYELQGQIAGTQQGGLRGGTENIPGIAGAVAAMQYTFTDRAKKNRHLELLKSTLVAGIDAHISVKQGVKMADLPLHDSKPYVTIIGPPLSSGATLQNTLLISVVDSTRQLCNGKLKKCLGDAGFIVSIGSACNTESKYASHVLDAMGAPPEVRRGTLRISFGDYNTEAQAKKFGDVLAKCLSSKRVTGG